MSKFLETKDLDKINEHKFVYWIDPISIKYAPQKDFKIDDVSERAADGDWDINLTSIDDTQISQAIRDVFVNGKIWNETVYFNDRLEKAWIINNADRAQYKVMRCSYLNYLFHSMRTFGYVQDPNSDLVGLLIGRDGQVILNNGRHRVAIAQLLKIPLIPVTIDVRHANWVSFRNEVFEYASMHGGMVYNQVKHVDLQRIKPRQENRVDDIIASMSPFNMSLVDLGANWGYFCNELSKYIDYCVGVEKDPIEFYFLEKLKKAYGGTYEIVLDDIVDFVEKNGREFDCILMMSVFHHVPKEKRDRLLNRILAREMFFQFPSKKELQIDEAEWVAKILNESCFKTAKIVGKRDDRRILLFER